MGVFRTILSTGLISYGFISDLIINVCFLHTNAATTVQSTKWREWSGIQYQTSGPTTKARVSQSARRGGNIFWMQLELPDHLALAVGERRDELHGVAPQVVAVPFHDG